MLTRHQAQPAYDSLARADAAFAAGNELLGAQKLWDAFAAMMDCVADKRGFPPCHSDDDIRRVLQELATPERDYYSQLLSFSTAERFRNAVRRGAMEDYEVEIFAPEVRRIIDELAELG